MRSANHLENHMLIGRNRSYEFAVGTLEQSEGRPARWIGYAIGYTPGGTETMFLFPEISEGGLAGVSDRLRCIQMASAIAQGEQYASYVGEPIEWEIEPSLRAKPDDFRCELCGKLFCPPGEPCFAESDGDFWE
jgi:hypothetical protein